MTAGGKSASQDAIARQWAMLRRIPRAPRKTTATDLADALDREGYGTSKRTVERDLAALQRHFPLECDDRSRPFGWSWSRQAHALDVPGLSPAEAVAFELVRRYLEPILPASILAALRPHFDSAARVLSADVPADDPRAWTRKIRVVHPTQLTIAPKVSPVALDAITEALMTDQQVRVHYGKDRQELTLHPIALIQRGPVSYLVATAFHYTDPRLYAIHRFASAEATGRPARKPEFNVDRWIADGALGFGRGQRIRLVAVFSESAATHLAETPLASDQLIEELGDGRTRVTAEVANTPLLVWWLRGFGEDVEVVSPASLREEMAKSAAATARRYRRRS